MSLKRSGIAATCRHRHPQARPPYLGACPRIAIVAHNGDVAISAHKRRRIRLRRAGSYASSTAANTYCALSNATNSCRPMAAGILVHLNRRRVHWWLMTYPASAPNGRSSKTIIRIGLLPTWPVAPSRCRPKAARFGPPHDPRFETLRYPAGDSRHEIRRP